MPQKQSGIDWSKLPDQQEDQKQSGINWSMLPDNQEPQTFGSQVWHALADPLWNTPREWAQRKAQEWTDPRNRLDANGNVQPMNPLKAFAIGALEGTGGVASDLTSPLSIGVTAATGGASMAAKAGLPQIARGLTYAGRAASIPFALHGAERATDPNATWGERAMGAAEAAGGAAGVMQEFPAGTARPKVAPKTNVPPPRPWNPYEDIIDLGPDDYSVGDPFRRIPPGPPSGGSPRALPPGPPTAPASTDIPVSQVNIPPDMPFDPVGAIRHGNYPEQINPDLANAPLHPGEAPYQAPAPTQPTGIRADLKDFFNQIRSGEPPPIQDDSIEAFVQRMQQADRDAYEFNMGRQDLKGRPGDKNYGAEATPFQTRASDRPTQAPIDPIEQLINELNGPEQIAPDAGFTVLDPDAGFVNNASGESSASVEAMNRDRGMRERGEQFMVFDRTGQGRPLIGVDAVDYAVRPGETKGIMGRDGRFQVLDDNGGRYPKQAPQPNAKLQEFSRQVGGDFEEPAFSLADRPPEIRTIQELEAKIAQLESKPALNEGGRNALARMKEEVAKRRQLEAENFGENFPQGASTEKGGVKIGADVKSLGKVLGTSLYKGDIATIATKELLQNSLDATRHLGSAGQIGVHLDDATGHITVTDNGKGLTPAEIQSIFTDLGASGKRSDEDAIGGFGLAKAAPLLGGEHVQVETVARDPNTGQLVRTSFNGTPDELLEGVNMDTEIMPEGTETGTSVKVKVPKNEYGTHSLHEARNFVSRLTQHSKIQTSIAGEHVGGKYGDYQFGTDRGALDGQSTGTIGERLRQAVSGKSNRMDPIEMAKLTNASGDVILSRPHDSTIGDRGGMNVHYLNKGMYQSSSQKYFGGQTVPGVPSDVLVDISAKVPEGHSDYPFTANRESLRGSVESLVNKYIDENIVNPAKDKYKQELQALYDNMPSTTTPEGNTLYFHDTQGKMSPEEYQHMMNNPIIHALGDHATSMMYDVLDTLKNHPEFAQEGWLDRLERTGIIFDEKVKGIHIPNPGTGQSAILINPLQIMAKRNPDEAALGFVHVVLHELSHVDPSIRGHDEDFAIQLSKVHELFGARRTINAQQQFLNTVAPDGDYTPEVQDLLQRYSDSRGRSKSKEDILRRTGIDSKAETGGTKGNAKPPRASREGTSILLENATPESAKRIMEAGYKFKGMRDDGRLEFVPGNPGELPIIEAETTRKNARPTARNAAGGGFPPGQGPPPRGRGPSRSSGGPPGRGSTPAFQNTPEKRAWWKEAFNLPRALMASMDLSAPLRQGMTLIHKKAFWTSLDDMVGSFGSQRFFDATMDGILERPLFRAREMPGGRYARSFAEEAGLKFTDLKSLSSREEQFMSGWAEKIPGVGRLVKASNRAYTGFLNKLRADTFEQLMRDSRVFGADGTTNLPLARAMAEYVNNATGRGSLGSLERSATALNSLLFSPRLIASRLKFLNPKTYWASPQPVRMEYLKSLFAVAAVGNTVVQLGKMMGGEVDNNPNSADYGKLKIGNTRLDPFAGFQQYVVAANRLLRPSSAELPGLREVEGGPINLVAPVDLAAGWLGHGGQQMSSTTHRKDYDLWNQQGPFDPTWMDIATRFFRGKAHPVLGFAISVAMGGKEMTGQKMDFTTMNPFDNAVAQRFIPIFLQDLYQLAKEDPALLPILGPASGLGMGVQVYDNNTGRQSRRQ